MAENKMENNTDCKSESHNTHLCHLMYEGFHYNNPAEYKKMVQDAQFRCQVCGRTASNSDYLCDPAAL